MAVCPGKIRLNGLVDIAEDGSWIENPKHPLYFMVRMEQIALPLYPQFGLEPNIYYIPPRWAPRRICGRCSGQAWTAPSGATPRLAEIAGCDWLFRTTQKMIFRYEIEEGPLVREVEVNGKGWQMYDDTVIGFDERIARSCG